MHHFITNNMVPANAVLPECPEMQVQVFKYACETSWHTWCTEPSSTMQKMLCNTRSVTCPHTHLSAASTDHTLRLETSELSVDLPGHHTTSAPHCKLGRLGHAAERMTHTLQWHQSHIAVFHVSVAGMVERLVPACLVHPPLSVMMTPE